MRRRTEGLCSRPRRPWARGAAAVLALTVSWAGASRAQTVAITGGKVYPVSGRPIENGTVLIRDGKIVAVGTVDEVLKTALTQPLTAIKWEESDVKPAPTEEEDREGIVTH